MELNKYAKNILAENGCDEYTYGDEPVETILEDLKWKYKDGMQYGYNYVEVANDGTVYDDWRLPTASELQIIIDLQGTSKQSADAIDYLLNANYYYSASGPVFNSKNDSGNKEHNANQSSWAIRCIRDAY